MKIIRFLDADGNERHGCSHPDGAVTLLQGDLFGEFSDTGESASVDKLLAPVHPTDILCIGLNYARHAEEGGQDKPEFPVLFMKASSAVQNPGDPIVLPRGLRSDEVDYECELAVVIGKPCHNVSREEALDHVLGYTCANDVSARDWQLKWGGGSGVAARRSRRLRRSARALSPATRSAIRTHSGSRPFSMARPCRTGTPMT